MHDPGGRRRHREDFRRKRHSHHGAASAPVESGLSRERRRWRDRRTAMPASPRRTPAPDGTPIPARRRDLPREKCAFRGTVRADRTRADAMRAPQHCAHQRRRRGPGCHREAASGAPPHADSDYAPAGAPGSNRCTVRRAAHLWRTLTPAHLSRYAGVRPSHPQEATSERVWRPAREKRQVSGASVHSSPLAGAAASHPQEATSERAGQGGRASSNPGWGCGRRRTRASR